MGGGGSLGSMGPGSVFMSKGCAYASCSGPRVCTSIGFCRTRSSLGGFACSWETPQLANTNMVSRPMIPRRSLDRLMLASLLLDVTFLIVPRLEEPDRRRVLAVPRPSKEDTVIVDPWVHYYN